MTKESFEKIEYALHCIRDITAHDKVARNKATNAFIFMAIDAIIMRLVTIGTVCEKMSEEEKVTYPYINWSEISKYKEFISTTGDFWTDDELETIIKKVLPQLQADFQKIYDENKAEFKPVGETETAKILARIRWERHMYFRQLNPLALTVDDFNLWLVTLTEVKRKSAEKRGLENCRQLINFQRFILEYRDFGMEEHLKNNLNSDDYAFYLRLGSSYFD